MLVLADANGFRVDFHQLGQRILQATGDGYRAAQRHVHVREFFGGQLGGRIHRSASLGDHDLGQLQARQLLDQVSGQLVGLAAGGAVADGDQVHRMFGAQFGEDRQGAVPVIAWCVRVNRRGFQHFAGGIDYGHFAAGAQAGVER